MTSGISGIKSPKERVILALLLQAPRMPLKCSRGKIHPRCLRQHGHAGRFFGRTLPTASTEAMTTLYFLVVAKTVVWNLNFTFNALSTRVVVAKDDGVVVPDKAIAWWLVVPDKAIAIGILRVEQLLTHTQIMAGAVRGSRVAWIAGGWAWSTWCGTVATAGTVIPFPSFFLFMSASSASTPLVIRRSLLVFNSMFVATTFLFKFILAFLFLLTFPTSSSC